MANPSWLVYPTSQLPNYTLLNYPTIQRPTTNDQRPTTNDQRPTTNDQRPTTNDQQLITTNPLLTNPLSHYLLTSYSIIPSSNVLKYITITALQLTTTVDKLVTIPHPLTESNGVYPRSLSNYSTCN